MKFNLALSTVLLLVTLAMSNASASYWIDWDNNLWISKTIPSGSSIVFNLTKEMGFSPNGTAVFPSFFADFKSSSTIQYDGIVTEKAELLAGAADVPLILNDHKIYATGGYGPSTSVVLNNEQIYDLDSDSWTQGATMPIAAWGATTVNYANKIYCYGGSNDKCGKNLIPHLQIYNITTNSWTLDPVQMPNSISHQGLMSATDSMNTYLLLGNYLYKHIIDTDTYTQLANCPVNISWGSFVYYPATNKIYLLGGAQNLSGKVGSNGVYAYDISSNSWSNFLAAAPYSVYGHTRENTLYGDKIIMGYGQGPSGIFHSEIYYYNITTNSWSQRFALGLHPRDGVGTAISGSSLYVIGGRDTTSGTHGITYNEKIDLQHLTANPHIIPDPSRWNYKQNSGQIDIKNGTLTITGNPTNYNYSEEWIMAKKGCAENNTLTMRAKWKIRSHVPSTQICKIGLSIDSLVINSNDLTSIGCIHYLESGDSICDLHKIGSFWFGNWYTYDISRTGTSTILIINGIKVHISDADEVGIIRYPHVFARQSNENIQVNYMFIHQYSATPPKVTIIPTQNYFQVIATNPGASDLINYQLKLSGLGITSQNESWNTEYIPKNQIRSTIYPTQL